jgi:hypothetical protein
MGFTPLCFRNSNWASFKALKKISVVPEAKFFNGVSVDFKWQVVFMVPHWYIVRLCLFMFSCKAAINFFRINDFHTNWTVSSIQLSHDGGIENRYNCEMNSFLFRKCITKTVKLFIINGECHFQKHDSKQIFQ